MRQITSNAINAFNQDKSFKSGNTTVETNNSETLLKLHGNTIATKSKDGKNTLKISNCGWKTNTTKERLNGLTGVTIHQANFQWFLNGMPWDGDLVVVTNSGFTKQ